MTTIHYVKDGVLPNGESITRSYEIPFPQLQQHIGNFSFNHSPTPPRINPETNASQMSEYKHVVIEIGSDDEGKTPFGDIGYYLVVGVTATKWHELFELPGSVF